MLRKLRKFLFGSDKGITAIEYGLLAALIALGLVAGAQALGIGLDTIFKGIGDEIKTVTIPAIP